MKLKQFAFEIEIGKLKMIVNNLANGEDQIIRVDGGKTKRHVTATPGLPRVYSQKEFMQYYNKQELQVTKYV